MLAIGKLFKLKYPVFLVIILSIPTFAALFHQGFFPTQDFIYIARIYGLDKALSGGQFPVRWVSNFRYGEPTFNFYAPLPYYIGALIHTFGVSFIGSAKILFALSFVLSGLTMFFLGRELYGDLGGMISAVLYMYAPYHSLDLYVRGAVSEGFSLIFFPLIFLFSLKFSKKSSIKNFIFLALSLAGLFYTHNIMTMLFLPFYFVWLIFLIYQQKSLKIFWPFLGSLVLGFGLGASFLLPAFFEKGLVQSNFLTGGYFDFRGHFVELKQFFEPFWGYGASLWGNQDGMSFQIGIVHWISLILVFALMVLNKFKNKKIIFLISVLALEFLFSLFMQHNKSTPIWLKLSILEFVQFPWRFLGISIFFVSLIGGAIGFYKNRLTLGLAIIIIVLAILFNAAFFRPQSYYDSATDADYISERVLSFDYNLPKDYLPIYVKKIDPNKLSGPISDKGLISASNFEEHSSWVQFDLNVLSPNATVEVPETYFPGWEGVANNQKITLLQPGELGLIKFSLPQGNYEIKLNFGNTPVRFWGDFLTIVSILSVICLLSFKKWKNFFRV